MTKTLSINKLYTNLKNFTDPQITKKKKSIINFFIVESI